MKFDYPNANSYTSPDCSSGAVTMKYIPNYCTISEVYGQPNSYYHEVQRVTNGIHTGGDDGNCKFLFLSFLFLTRFDTLLFDLLLVLCYIFMDNMYVCLCVCDYFLCSDNL